MKIFQTLQINKHPLRFFLTPSHIFGFGSFIAMFLLYLADVRLAFIPPVLFVLACFIAPFFPKIGFFLPVIQRGNSDKKAVAITFDDGPDPQTTPFLLTLLSKYNANATFFVTGKNADAYPELIKRILSEGHSIGNHTYSHDTFIMLKPLYRLKNEIEIAQKSLMKQGVIPLAFRPPVGITNPKLYKILERSGLYCVNYSRRACDAGNKRINHLSYKILKHIKANDIILLHDTTPKTDSDLVKWFNEIDKLLKGILDKGLIILPLSEIIERPVMKTAKPV